ncbi:hypothetical protein Micbo1qcDRAFT_222808 [Microdochium bolleyi]|uniref:Uncharacterized protein n=1 Tax=Microdochium bolleyi TaxID=196109 RepID=A0A136J7G2_9PEZI|nr:hypothetical protein Micbo1qcDRAFT_222808 [Microdochium bolleyi]
MFSARAAPQGGTTLPIGWLSCLHCNIATSQPTQAWLFGPTPSLPSSWSTQPIRFPKDHAQAALWVEARRGVITWLADDLLANMSHCQSLACLCGRGSPRFRASLPAPDRMRQSLGKWHTRHYGHCIRWNHVRSPSWCYPPESSLAIALMSIRAEELSSKGQRHRCVRAGTKLPHLVNFVVPGPE